MAVTKGKGSDLKGLNASTHTNEKATTRNKKVRGSGKVFVTGKSA